MKKNKIKISNINKKLIALGLTFALIPTVFAGCTDTATKEFTYSTNEQGEYIVTGNIEFDVLKNYYFIQIDNPNFDTSEFYIAEKQAITGSYAMLIGYSYLDIFTNREVLRRYKDGSNIDSKSNRTLITEIKLSDYLYTLDQVKNVYTKEDVEQILEELKKINIEKENKQLVK